MFHNSLYFSNIMDYELEDLDSSWIELFEKNDSLYKDYYLEELEFINLNLVYVDENMEIETVKEDVYLFKDKSGTIKRDELLGLIKSYMLKNYRLLTILKYNITIEPEKMVEYFKTKHICNLGTDFLTPIASVDDIVFKKSIGMFHSLNSLTIVFYIKPRKSKKLGTKRNINEIMKKIFNKTIKKRT
jgi:hypothetical protein